jgi:2,3-bisphosphoglycerate-independent phosphoglycerate mutase
MSDKKVLLAILDGWGIGPNPANSAIVQGNTPFTDSLMKNYPNATLLTHGLNVGLPDGQMGNSEVGHMNIGAGRIVYQDLVKINMDIKKNKLVNQKAIQDGIAYAKENGSAVHLMGLVSDGGVHSHINHLEALCKIMEEAGVPNTYIHAFTDGRDTDPHSGKKYLSQLNATIEELPHVALASLIGRYYAMDRDKRWERIKKAYDLIVKGLGEQSQNIIHSLENSYKNGKTDEFIEPIVMVDEYGQPVAKLKDGDVVIFFNFRSDRPRELTTVLSQEDFPDHDMQKLDLHFITMTPYDDSFKNIQVVYSKQHLENTIGEVLEKHGKTQLRIAETEKYAHVTFFFSGGREQEFKGESRILVPSPKVPTYDLKPEMSAPEVTEEAIAEMKKNQPSFICLNYANSDMVGHTGVFEAAVKAVETVDSCLEKLSKAALNLDYDIIVIADHGNSDVMRNPDGSVNTAHSLSPVPIIWMSNDKSDKQLKNGILADVSPTILDLMGIEQPKMMEGKSLIN